MTKKEQYNAILNLRKNYVEKLKIANNEQEIFTLKVKIVTLGEALDAIGYNEDIENGELEDLINEIS
jgi:hypothetical protein